MAGVDTGLIIAIVVALLILVGGTTALVLRSRRTQLPPPRPRPGIDYTPGVGDDATTPRDTPTRTVEDVGLPSAGTAVLEPEAAEVEVVAEEAVLLETPAPVAGRWQRLKARLARSNSTLGQALLRLLSSDHIDEQTWEEIEDTLIMSDLGVAPSQELVDQLRTRVRIEGTADPERVKQMLREELLALVDPGMDREVTMRGEEGPAVLLMVGVNGTGKTTTTGKLARILIAEDRSVVLGAADTFRAAASQQLQTWGDRVGAHVVRGPEGSDPAAVAFDAVSDAVAQGSRHRGPAPHEGGAHGRAWQGQKSCGEAGRSRRGTTRARRHYRSKRYGPGQGVRRCCGHHRDCADETGRNRQRRHCGVSAAGVGRSGQVGGVG
jgi:fused signal recognition particle receptor